MGVIKDVVTEVFTESPYEQNRNAGMSRNEAAAAAPQTARVREQIEAASKR